MNAERPQPENRAESASGESVEVQPLEEVSDETGNPLFVELTHDTKGDVVAYRVFTHDAAGNEQTETYEDWRLLDTLEDEERRLQLKALLRQIKSDGAAPSDLH